MRRGARRRRRKGSSKSRRRKGSSNSRRSLSWNLEFKCLAERTTAPSTAFLLPPPPSSHCSPSPALSIFPSPPLVLWREKCIFDSSPPRLLYYAGSSGKSTLASLPRGSTARGAYARRKEQLRQQGVSKRSTTRRRALSRSYAGQQLAARGELVHSARWWLRCCGEEDGKEARKKGRGGRWRCDRDEQRGSKE